MREIPLLKMYLVAAVLLVCQQALALEGLGDEWKLVKDRKGIQVYVNDVEDSRLKAFRGVTVLEPEEPYSVVAALLDFDDNHKIFHFVSDMEELEVVTPFNRLVRVHTMLPWPVKDREAIARVFVKQNPETYQLLAEIRSEDSSLPVQDGYVRIPEFSGLLKMEMLGGKKIQVIYEIIMDPGGRVPLWAVQMALKDVPYFTLRKLKRYVDKPKYQDQEFGFLKYPGDGEW